MKASGSTNRTKAVGYIRVSSIKQVQGESLDTQKAQIEAYCTMNSWDLGPIYVEPGVSGTATDRPALLQLLAAAHNHEMDVVVVRDITRFGRTARHILNNIEELRSNKVRFVSIKDGVDLDTPIGRVMLTILSGIAELERETIMARTSENRYARWKDNRSFVGLVPYGYTFDDKTKKLVQLPEEATTYLRIVSDYLDLNLSLRDIAVRLNHDHIPTRKGKTWTAATLSVLLRHTLHLRRSRIQQARHGQQRQFLR